jgi:glycosyltransferase involved in cell wall biosynthesis
MISYCTACKNRLHHLKITLPKTLENISKDDEVIILDYDSTDKLSEWIVPYKDRISYFKLNEGPQTWKMGRAKNIAHRLASGKILCNIDADNWVCKGFSEYLQKLKSGHVARAPQNNNGGGRGRVAMYSFDFNRLGGYDERMQVWGYDVTDITDRARSIEFEIDTIPDELIKYIDHGDGDRYLGEFKSKMESAMFNMRIGKDTLRRGICNPNGLHWGEAKILSI